MNKYSQNYLNELIQSGLNLDHSRSFVSAGNPANHGQISPLYAKLQEFGLMKRPNVSDYAYESMKARGRIASKNIPSILASNPNLKMFGRLGKNTIFQALLDKITPGGSRVDAYKSSLGNSLGGYGIKNMERNSELSKNFLNSMDSAMAGSDGQWDYSKSHGFNRSETVNNLAAFKKRFG
jgi:hypothetical protein